MLHRLANERNGVNPVCPPVVESARACAPAVYVIRGGDVCVAGSRDDLQQPGRPCPIVRGLMIHVTGWTSAGGRRGSCLRSPAPGFFGVLM